MFSVGVVFVFFSCVGVHPLDYVPWGRSDVLPCLFGMQDASQPLFCSEGQGGLASRLIIGMIWVTTRVLGFLTFFQSYNLYSKPNYPEDQPSC